MPKLSNLKFIYKININLTVVFYIVLKNTVIMNEIRYRINNNNILSMYRHYVGQKCDYEGTI